MDLFDANSLFSGQVSMIAGSRPMVYTAACALSAKHISQLPTTRPERTCGTLAREWSRQLPLDMAENNLRYESVRFYDAAIKQTKKALLEDSINTTYGDEKLSSEEILAVVAILSMYELMDAPGMEWKAHLGALPLLDEPPGHPTSASPLPKTLARKSLFWTFARQDVMSACKLRSPHGRTDNANTIMRSCSRDSNLP